MPSLYNPTQLKQLCKKYNLTPSKRYGQNFLINQKPIDKMIEAAKLSKADVVYEIGPGFGILTNELVKEVKQVKAFEIEKKISSFWEEKLKQHKNLEIIWGNALRVDETGFSKKYKVVANLPYQITSAVLRKFLESSNKPESMVIMVQKEVAERICAQPGSMSLLAVSVQYYGQPKIITTVSKNSYWPVPKVDSAVLAINDIAKTQHDFTDKQFFSVLKMGFSSRRKLLLNNLLPLFAKDKKQARKQVLEILKKLNLEEKIRAQELGVQQWIKLVSYLAKNVL